MHRVVVRIVARHDPADDFSSAPGEKQSGVAMQIKRVALPIDETFALDDKRRDPSRIIFVNPPREFDKRVAFPA